LKNYFKIQNLLLLFVFATFLSNCTTKKHLGDEEYLLTKNSIVLNEQKIKNKDVFALLKQKPNKKFLGLSPLYLHLYNLSSENQEENYFKKIGEPPVIFNQKLAKKSATQIEMFYKNKGFLEAKSSFDIEKRNHKAKLIYTIKTGDSYKINSLSINKKNNAHLSTKIDSLLKESPLKKGEIYQFEILEQERLRIANELQNQGYYQFNKEFIHFIADTNQKTKEIQLELLVKPIEKNENGILTKENHKLGIIREVKVYLDTEKTNPNNDTTLINGILFVENKTNTNFNLNRLVEKINIKPGVPYGKNKIDKSYQALSDLKNFKKISFEFNPINTKKKKDDLSADIYLISGRKIAYTIELEASHNPQLKEGISGSVSLSHHNIFGGSERLELIYKGSKNINLNDPDNLINISENRWVMNLSIPSLISPLKSNRNYKKSRTETIFTTSWAEQKRPEFTRKSITGNLTYQWKNKPNTKHKLALFNLSYVNFQGDATDLSNISEYLIAKDYSNHLIPTSSYTLNINNQEINKLKNHGYFQFHIESSGSALRELASTINLNKLKDNEGNIILQENGEPTYTINLGNTENIFTQYIKSSIDYRYYWKVDQKNNFAIRAMGGIIYAFGNTSQAPFQKKFIAGGANDLRGWQAFKKPTGNLSSTSDTLFTGGIKLLASAEYRFNILRKLKGALFVDAGNIWEIKSNNNKYEAANFYWSEFIDQIAVNIGFGIRYDFKYFILRTDLGFPVRDPYENSTDSWEKISLNKSQINIGLGYPF
jgi:outer membrane protein assembly factor BamA